MTSKEFTEAQRLQAGPMAKDNPFARPAPTPEQIDNLRGRIAVLVKRGGNDGLLTNLDVNLLATLTAAAGVGEQSRFIIEADHDVIAATIERCAQVAEDYGPRRGISKSTGEEIAAAIRALKDK